MGRGGGVDRGEGRENGDKRKGRGDEKEAVCPPQSGIQERERSCVSYPCTTQPGNKDVSPPPIQVEHNVVFFHLSWQSMARQELSTESTPDC